MRAIPQYTIDYVRHIAHLTTNMVCELANIQTLKLSSSIPKSYTRCQACFDPTYRNN